MKSLILIFAAMLLLLCGTPSSFAEDLNWGPAVQGPGHRYELFLRYFYEHYSYYSRDTNGVGASLTYRDLERVTLFGELIKQDKFRTDETQLNLGGAYKFTDATTIQEIAGFSSGDGSFPEFYSHTELIHRIYSSTYLHAGYKYSSFEDVKGHVLSAGMTVYPMEKFYLHMTWFHAISDFSGSSADGKTDSFLLRAGVYPAADSEAAVFYGRNSDSFLSRDQIGEVDSNTYGLMIKTYIYEHWGVLASLSYEERDAPSGGYRTRLDIGILYRL